MRTTALKIVRHTAILAAMLALPVAALADRTEATQALMAPAVVDDFAAEFDDGFFDDQASYADPLESLNRGTLAFNRQVDFWLINPIIDVYQFVLPQPARRSVRNFLDNLDSPVVFANDLLQRKWGNAGTTVARFGINTTVGVAGLFDPASSFGWDKHVSDFGQTLALEGVPAGAYIVLPLLGPTTLRDGVGDVVDMAFRPTTFLIPVADQILYSTLYGGSYGLATREDVADELAALEESSVDYYAALRNAFYQTRSAEVWDGHDQHESLLALAGDWVPPSFDWTEMRWYASWQADGGAGLQAQAR